MKTRKARPASQTGPELQSDRGATSHAPAVHGDAERKPEATATDDRRLPKSGALRAEPALPAEAFWKAAGRFARLR
jgi:hypothetical protein